MHLRSGAFRLDGKEVTVGEVLLGGLASGSLWPLLEDVKSRLAKVSMAREQGDDVGEDEIQVAFDAWRIDRDLIAAEEFERWLEQHGVTIDDLVACLERRLLADRVRSGGVGAVSMDLADLLALAPDEALFAGALEGFTEGFALRACAPDPAQGEDARIAQATHWLLAAAGLSSEQAFLEAGEALDVPPPRARWVLDRETAFHLHQQDVLTPDALRQALGEMREDLRRYEVAMADFRDEDTAREVACCVREDRDSFRRACSRAGEAQRVEEWFQQDLPSAELGDRIAAAGVNDLIGPRPTRGGRQLLALLKDVKEPVLSEPAVLPRVERRLVERTLRRQLQQRVMFPPTRLGAR